MAAVLLSVGEGSSKASSSSNPDEILFYGIVPVLVASVLSGLASALCQWASQVSKHCYFMKGFFIFSPFWYACHLLQVKKHSSYLMTVEMSIIGSFCLISSTSKSPDGEAIRQHGFFYGWTALTLVNQLCQYAFFFLYLISWNLVKLVLRALKTSRNRCHHEYEGFLKKVFTFLFGDIFPTSCCVHLIHLIRSH